MYSWSLASYFRCFLKPIRKIIEQLPEWNHLEQVVWAYVSGFEKGPTSRWGHFFLSRMNCNLKGGNGFMGGISHNVWLLSLYLWAIICQNLYLAQGETVVAKGMRMSSHLQPVTDNYKFKSAQNFSLWTVAGSIQHNDKCTTVHVLSERFFWKQQIHTEN